MRSKNYIIYTFPWDDNNGGVIFMHNLAHELNQMGEKAFLWSASPIYKQGLYQRLRNWVKSEPMHVNPLLNTPLARSSDLSSDSIVVYPEVVLGNPLNAKNVVRWLLYKPGVMHPYQFGKDEMFFRVGSITDIHEITGGAPDLLMWKVNPIYQDAKSENRSGVAYAVRKGRNKTRIPETESVDAVCIDGMSHTEINSVFNRCVSFYSYDEATMYSQYAAVCGCISVVVPGMFRSRDEWVLHHPQGKFGVAYGASPSEIEHACATRHLLVADLCRKEAESLQTVRHFVSLTHRRFWM
jgi:hypothetical protein